MKDRQRPYSPDARTKGTGEDGGNPTKVSSPDQVGLTQNTELPRMNEIPKLDNKTGSKVTPFAGRSAAITPPPRPAEDVMPWLHESGGIEGVSATPVPSGAERTSTQPITSAPVGGNGPDQPRAAKEVQGIGPAVTDTEDTQQGQAVNQQGVVFEETTVHAKDTGTRGEGGTKSTSRGRTIEEILAKPYGGVDKYPIAPPEDGKVGAQHETFTGRRGAGKRKRS